MQEVDVQQEDQKVKAILEWVARVRRAWDTQTNVDKKQDLYPECGLAQGTTHNSLTSTRGAGEGTEET